MTTTTETHASTIAEIKSWHRASCTSQEDWNDYRRAAIGAFFTKMADIERRELTSSARTTALLDWVEEEMAEFACQDEWIRIYPTEPKCHLRRLQARVVATLILAELANG